MANRKPGERTHFPAWVFPALLIVALLFSRVILACLAGFAGAERLASVLHFVCIFLLLFALPFLPFRTYGIYRAQGRGRASIFLLLSCLAAFLFVSQADPSDQIQILLYFLLGTALYRARSARGRNTGIRCYLDIFLFLMITVFLEEIVKGLSPASHYYFGINSNIVMGLAGALFARNLDFARAYGSKQNRGARKYKGAAPLLDLHFYWRDVVFVLLAGTLFSLPPEIHSFYLAEDFVGTWSIPPAGDTLFRLSETGRLRCEPENIGSVPIQHWHVEGNLLDGYFLSITSDGQADGSPCSFLNPWFEKRNRFRVRGDTLVFDNRSSDWVWPLKTLFRWKGPAGDTAQWKRVK